MQSTCAKHTKHFHKKKEHLCWGAWQSSLKNQALVQMFITRCIHRWSHIQSWNHKNALLKWSAFKPTFYCRSGHQRYSTVMKQKKTCTKHNKKKQTNNTPFKRKGTIMWRRMTIFSGKSSIGPKSLQHGVFSGGQVASHALTPPKGAWLRWSEKNRYLTCAGVVDERKQWKVV